MFECDICEDYFDVNDGLYLRCENQHMFCFEHLFDCPPVPLVELPESLSIEGNPYPVDRLEQDRFIKTLYLVPADDCPICNGQEYMPPRQLLHYLLKCMDKTYAQVDAAVRKRHNITRGGEFGSIIGQIVGVLTKAMALLVGMGEQIYRIGSVISSYFRAMAFTPSNIGKQIGNYLTGKELDFSETKKHVGGLGQSLSNLISPSIASRAISGSINSTKDEATIEPTIRLGKGATGYWGNKEEKSNESKEGVRRI